MDEKSNVQETECLDAGGECHGNRSASVQADPDADIREDIRFDASAHITITMFCLYFAWFYVDQNKSWRTPFFVFAMVVISIVSLQRLMVNAHNDVGLLAGLMISLAAIAYSQKEYFKDKLRF